MANASLLDEGTAAAEACGLALAGKAGAARVVVSNLCHPHVIDVVRTRMEPLGIATDVVDLTSFKGSGVKDVAAVVASYPDTLGVITDLEPVAAECRTAEANLLDRTSILLFEQLLMGLSSAVAERYFLQSSRPEGSRLTGIA